jgi:hypothetical protein
MWSNRKLQIDSGIEPDTKVSCSRNSLSISSFPGEIDGTVPVILFPSNQRSLNKGGFAYSFGMGPDSEQFDMYTSRIVGIENTVAGIVPVSIFSEISKKVSFSKSWNTSGIVPTQKLSLSLMVSAEVIESSTFMLVDGIFPV